MNQRRAIFGICYRTLFNEFNGEHSMNFTCSSRRTQKTSATCQTTSKGLLGSCFAWQCEWHIELGLMFHFECEHSFGDFHNRCMFSRPKQKLMRDFLTATHTRRVHTPLTLSFSRRAQTEHTCTVTRTRPKSNIHIFHVGAPRRSHTHSTHAHIDASSGKALRVRKSLAGEKNTLCPYRKFFTKRGHSHTHTHGHVYGQEADIAT